MTKSEAAAALAEAARPIAAAAADLLASTRDTSEIWELPAAMSITAGDLRRMETALAAFDAAESEGWREDRPGWYWIKRRQIGWEPRQWVVHGYIRFWDRDVREPEIKPIAIGPAIPLPPPPADGGGK